MTAVSGGIRLYLACLLAGVAPDCLSCIGAGLTIYSIYTLDRALESKEDHINHKDYRFARRSIGVGAAVAAFILGAVFFSLRDSGYAPFIPLVVGFFYSKGIRMGNHKFRLKGSLGGKNLVIGLTWGGTIAIVIAPAVGSILTVFAVFVFFFTKLFINSALYDMKDTEGDQEAGILTLPVVLGPQKTKRLLGTLCVSVHVFIAACMAAGIIRPEISILAISAVMSCTILRVYSSALEQSFSWLKRNCRVLLIDGEAPVCLVFRFIIAEVFCANGVGRM